MLSMAEFQGKSHCSHKKNIAAQLQFANDNMDLSEGFCENGWNQQRKFLVI